MASETVQFWIDEFKTNGVSLDDEIEDIKGSISNDRIIIKGAANEDEVRMFTNNLNEHEEYLEWLKEQKDKEEY